MKQRSLAKQMCDRGQVRVDGKKAKASKEITPGRTVGLETEQEAVDIEVVSLPERNYRRKDGRAFYRIIKHERKRSL